MSRKLFEFFYNPVELEPFYPELMGTKPITQPSRSKRKQKPIGKARKPNLRPAPPEDRPNNQGRIDDTRTDEIDRRVSRETSHREPSGIREPVTNDVDINSAPAEIEQPNERGAECSEQPPSANNNESIRTRVRNMLSVHALGQYVFCPRSAILAAERGDERDIDEPLPRLTFLPNFDLARIEEALSAKMKQLLLAVVLIAALTVSLIVSSRDQTWGQFYLAAGTLFLSLFWAAHLLTTIAQLALRRLTAIHTEASEPHSSFNGTLSINWWSMLNAGFEPINYQRPFQHPELPLEGCPWRVLHKDSLRIPVIRTGGDRLGEGKNRLFPKHEVRLTAYALLLEADGHHRVPYGLVFPVDSPDGIAFAITDSHRRQAAQLLSEFEQKLNDSQQRDLHPSLPEHRNRCAKCDYGKPIVTSIREINSVRKAGEQVVVLQSRSDELYRCDCGDRFGSAPPHQTSVRKGLRAVLE